MNSVDLVAAKLLEAMLKTQGKVEKKRTTDGKPYVEVTRLGKSTNIPSYSRRTGSRNFRGR